MSDVIAGNALWHQQFDWLADHFIAVVAEQDLRLAVCECNVTVGSNEKHRVRHLYKTSKVDVLSLHNIHRESSIGRGGAARRCANPNRRKHTMRGAANCHP